VPPDTNLATGPEQGAESLATKSIANSMSTTPDRLQNDSRAGRLAQPVMALKHCLLIVRHGQTQWNVEDRMATHTDVPLTPIGLAQASLLADSLTGAAFDRAWASPMERALLTAQTALRHATISSEMTADPRLLEPSAGLFEGIGFDELEHRGAKSLREAYARYVDESNPVFPPGAEPLDQSAARARDFLTDIETTPRRHLAVSHGAFIRILLCVFLGADPTIYRRLKLDNCHAALLKFYPQLPHQLVGLNLSPA
jgi:broad specificity phosphatase PhoE